MRDDEGGCDLGSKTAPKATMFLSLSKEWSKLVDTCIQIMSLIIASKRCEIYSLSIGVEIARIHKLRLERLVLVGQQ